MAERYTTDGTAILDSGFHIGDFISPQHAQSIAAALNAPPAAVPADFTEWLAREMPAGTVIGDPQWWANLIARRFAQFAAKENTNG